MELFQKQGFHPRHDLGQNFLIDLNLIDFVVRAADVGPEDVVLEVGTGTGSLTTFLSIRAAHVVSVEVDDHVYGLAQETTAEYPNITLLHCDALKNKNHLNPLVLEQLQAQLSVSPERKLKLVANLPYCVATPVISNLIAGDLPWECIVATIQWELGLKMKAQPGSEDYGALSAWLQSQARVKVLKKLGPMVFWPRPTVDSAVIRILPDAKLQGKIVDPPFFHDFMRRVFGMRRKLLRSVLVAMYGSQIGKPGVDAALAPFKLTEGTRAEALDPKLLVQISNAFHAALHPTQSASPGG